MFVGMGANGAGGGYNLENSLRFRSSASAYLEKTFTTTPTNRNKWTYSCWFKRGALGGSLWTPMMEADNGSNSDSIGIYNDKLYFGLASGTQSVTIPMVFRDPSAWYHLIISWDSTQATLADALKIYVNGIAETSFSPVFGTLLTTSAVFNFGNTVQNRIGARSSGTAFYYDGYMTEVNFVDGQALTQNDFGETNSTTGVWQPKEYTGTYGTNGFYLKGRGTDNSGNGNNWTENNFNTTNSALTTYDIMTDVPTLTDEDTANYATLNATMNSATGTLSNANLTQTKTFCFASSTMAMTANKYYWEILIQAQGSAGVVYGIISSDVAFGTSTGTQTISGSATGYGYDAKLGRKWIATVLTTGQTTSTVNDILGFAFDGTALTLSLYKNNSLLFTISGITAGSYVAQINGGGTSGTDQFSINFGQRPFAYTPPTGYKKLNTFNLPDSSIVDGSENFVTALYTGNGVARSIDNTITDASGVETGDPIQFQPDLVWMKRRTVDDHDLQDSVRGGGKSLISNSTAAEANLSGSYGISSFDANGFSLIGNGGRTNESGGSYAAWNWKAGGTAVLNEAGTIDSQVSANPTAGFSVATFTTPTSGTFTFGHGLGVAPAMVIVKRRSSTSSWGVWHKGLSGGTYYVLLDTTGAQVNSSAVFTAVPTSTVVNMGTAWATSATMVAYCFADVEGYSKFGSYTGNGSADGPFVYTGFRPAFILVKAYSQVGNWFIMDATRDPNNVATQRLFANSSNAEDASGLVDFTANGFKLRMSSALNDSANYIYMAFAENPFKNSLAR